MASSRSKKDGFQKKCLNHSITLLQQISDKRDAQLFRYFGYKKCISCIYRCEFDGRKCNAKQNWNIDNCHGECKKNNKRFRIQRRLCLQS